MKKALSLIEICISVVMLGIMLVSMLGIICQGYRYLRLTRERIGAYYLAMGVMEEYSSWDKLKELAGTPPVNDDYDLDNVELNNIDYDRDVTIAGGPVSPLTLRRVDVTVSWGTLRGTREYTLSTLKANY